MSAHEHTHGYGSYPNIERHEVAWHALGRARLSDDLSPTPQYNRRIVSLMLKFLSAAPPSKDEFDAVVEACLDELRDATFPGGIELFGHDAEAWRRAGEWLKLADQAAAGTLE